MPRVNSKNQSDPALTPADLKHFMKRHLEAARTLKSKRKYGMVAYHLGYALEFALKMCICKHLSQATYPSHGHGGDEGRFFKSHSFERLYMLSGLQDLFDRGKPYANLYDSFTQEYIGEDWTKMRYDRKIQKYLSDKRVAERLYNTLKGHGRSASKSILGMINKKNKW